MKQLVILLILSLLAVACSDNEALNCYHRAQQLAEQGDAPQALKLFRQATDWASTDSLQAAVCSDMGDLLFNEGLQEEALGAYLRAYEADQRIADTIATVRDLCNIANVYRTREADDSCLYFFRQALQLVRQQEDVPAKASIESQMAGYYLWHKKFDQARRLLLPLLADTAELSGGLCFMAADLYRQTGPKDSARYYCNLLLNEEETGLRQMAHKWLAKLLMAEGRYDEAARHLEQYELLTDSLMEETDTEALRRVSALYDYTEHERQNAQLEQRVILAVAIVVLLAVALVALLLYFSRRRLYYRLKLQRLEQLLADYRQRSAEDATAQPHTALADTPIGKRIGRLLSDPAQPIMTDEDWRILEATIEKVSPGFRNRLLSFHSLSTQELRISLLLKAGTTPAGIAQLTSHSKQSVSSTRSRLYAKVFGRKGTPAQWDEFVQSL